MLELLSYDPAIPHLKSHDKDKSYNERFNLASFRIYLTNFYSKDLSNIPLAVLKKMQKSLNNLIRVLKERHDSSYRKFKESLVKIGLVYANKINEPLEKNIDMFSIDLFNIYQQLDVGTVGNFAKLQGWFANSSGDSSVKALKDALIYLISGPGKKLIEKEIEKLGNGSFWVPKTNTSVESAAKKELLFSPGDVEQVKAWFNGTGTLTGELMGKVQSLITSYALSDVSETILKKVIKETKNNSDAPAFSLLDIRSIATNKGLYKSIIFENVKQSVNKLNLSITKAINNKLGTSKQNNTSQRGRQTN